MKQYPAEIIENAKLYGYKAANLMFAKKVAEEFNKENPNEKPVVVSEIYPIASNDIIYHLDQCIGVTSGFNGTTSSGFELSFSFF